jgi:cysteinyl-tRNA synthetase
LAEARQAARVAKDFAESDALRDQIAAAGYSVKDTATGFEITKL